MSDKLEQLKATLGDSVLAKPVVVNHNSTDYGRFHDFMAMFSRNHAATDAGTREAVVSSNLQEWVASLPVRYRDVTVRTLKTQYEGESTTWVCETLEATPEPVSWFLGGRGDYNNVAAAYAILRRYMGLGYTTVAGAKIIKETDLLRMGRAGYRGVTEYEQLLKTPITATIFETNSITTNYSEQQDTYISELLEKFYESNTVTIIVSPLPFTEWVSKLSHTTENQIREILGTRILDATPKTVTNNTTTNTTKWWDNEN